ncbi:unnamed protein product [Dovyalis caffra]|uniref:Uncharacterized protein n=1 Tax=Dovyalis caffra TaxID=77055 RepID=A0AAV1S6X0_9ROSI|nr:unnamed protein product [Dovyalis caffra]
MREFRAMERDPRSVIRRQRECVMGWSHTIGKLELLGVDGAFCWPSRKLVPPPIDPIFPSAFAPCLSDSQFPIVRAIRVSFNYVGFFTSKSINEMGYTLAHLGRLILWVQQYENILNMESFHKMLLASRNKPGGVQIPKEARGKAHEPKRHHIKQGERIEILAANTHLSMSPAIHVPGQIEQCALFPLPMPKAT